MIQLSRKRNSPDTELAIKLIRDSFDAFSKKHYKKLLSSNPRFLFETVMPTVEWIEVTLGKLDKKSQQVGREQFTKMVNSGVVMSVFHSL